ncbi:TlpA disulfide reductase family protein [uncultured Lutibacter sp.]|uniref:TlpA family protein disulfide reductase n=1 Tax=uncultured Lutibacter sp. TaxID=437739 RepID=UPI002613FEEA|nr:TlpA disulfide reductase family protein [uncultured Lutibacter sp.]
MKYIWFFVAVLMVVSCKEEAPVDYAIISGNITNQVGELTINSADRLIKKVMNVAEDGSFTDTLRVKTETYILFDGKNRASVYIDAGNNINVSYDANDFENSLIFSGVGSEISNYLFSKEKKEKELSVNGTEVYELEEIDYKANFNKIKTALTEMITSFEGISEEFKVKEKRNIDYAYLNKISIYERYHSHYAEKPDFKTSEGFLNELEGLSYDSEEDFSFSQSYKSMVTSHFNDEAAKLVETDSIAEDIAFLKVVGAIQNDVIKNNLLVDNAKYSVTYTNDLEAYYSEFMKVSTNEDNNKLITESYNKLKTVAKGQPSPQFDNYENFAGGTTSLSDLKGKYVYVDVWATWCGPCKREIPFLQKVEKQYHGKNIEFVSLSVDKLDDHNKWQEMVKEEELGGIQLFADKSWESDFVTGYLIKGIPRFILIDPNGNIVNSNAPRPSESKLIDLFNELSI